MFDHVSSHHSHTPRLKGDRPIKSCGASFGQSNDWCAGVEAGNWASAGLFGFWHVKRIDNYWPNDHYDKQCILTYGLFEYVSPCLSGKYVGDIPCTLFSIKIRAEHKSPKVGGGTSIVHRSMACCKPNTVGTTVLIDLHSYDGWPCLAVLEDAIMFLAWLGC